MKFLTAKKAIQVLKDHKVSRVLRVKREQQVLPVSKVLKDHKVNKALKAYKAPRVTPVNKVLRVPTVRMA